MSDAQHEFGNFLRSRRTKLTPEAVGLAAGRRRRTPGLRREEVAELANIGVDWYVRLEQGRAVTPSVMTVDALARALRLNKMEHAHLKALASGSNPRPFVRETVPVELRQMVETFRHPSYITGRRWDVLAWNSAASALFGFDRMRTDDCNILVLMLLNPVARRQFGTGWNNEARRVVARFRATHDLWAGDPAFIDLLSRLRDGCVEFERWWDAHEIHGGAGGTKRLRHPTKGMSEYTHASFQSNDDPNLKLVVYTPTGSAPRSR